MKLENFYSKVILSAQRSYGENRNAQLACILLNIRLLKFVENNIGHEVITLVSSRGGLDR